LKQQERGEKQATTPNQTLHRFDAMGASLVLRHRQRCESDATPGDRF